MNQYYGKKVMVLNVASFCVYTPEYTPLQQLYDQYHQYNFEIVGFPSNDFLNQGGTDSQIISTCHTYNVSFQIMQTVHVVSGDTSPIFKWLQRKDLNGVSNATVGWNFNKFLIDEAGHWVRWYDSQTSPLDTNIINWIMSPSVTAGVPDLGKDDLIELKSANPGNTSVDFAVKSGQRFDINMYAIDGKLVGNIYHGSAANGQLISYPVSSLASGVYIIKVQTELGQRSIRYIVNR
jgi:glutathione peroxidase